MSDQNTKMDQDEIKTLQEQVALLTKLPAPAQAPDALESGIVRIFNDDNFGNNNYDIEIEGQYASDKRHRLFKDCYNKATWITWNLPLNTVVTMMEHERTLDKGQFLADIRGCGRCLELVGTGKTEAVDLDRLHMNDCFKGFFWREVDLKMGAIEVFDTTIEGLKEQKMWARHTIFLSEWTPGTPHSLQSWELHDKINSVRWRTLQDRQTVTFYEHSDGTGSEYSNIKGWGKTKEEKDLHRIEHGDKFSSFSWNAINPVKEEIEPINVTADPVNGSPFFNTISGTNDGDQPQPGKISIMETMTQEITVETTDTTATAVEASLQTTAKAGAENAASYEVQWSLSVSHSWEHTDHKSTKVTKTKAIIVEEPIVISPRRKYTAKLYVDIGKVANKVYKAKATRWYKQNLSGCEKDKGLYKRVETIKLNVSSSLQCSVRKELHEYPLDDSKLNAAIDKGQSAANKTLDTAQEKGKNIANMMNPFDKTGMVQPNST